ncbi:hypothetical protein B296_00052068 [Ensete ventricosum]|uniref:Uncharacterized protein n=1 Tax=Ensete ventricosum TaxID=4639 RepID=A0A426XKW8_ENSVE|nr:hypothetical protein B296_00052068 [Ensete ventricosum]
MQALFYGRGSSYALSATDRGLYFVLKPRYFHSAICALPYLVGTYPASCVLPASPLKLSDLGRLSEGLRSDWSSLQSHRFRCLRWGMEVHLVGATRTYHGHKRGVSVP